MLLKDNFLLRNDITFLNFGSFGACPKPVFQHYQQLQMEMEQEPVAFMVYNSAQYLQQSRTALGQYINCSPNDVVYVSNPSYAVNIVGKNLPLKPGDEVLTTDLEYGACDKAMSYYCKQKGINYIRRAIPFPIQSKEAFLNHFLEGVTPKTKMIFISHITSATALKLPVEEIIAFARTNGILTFVDGAHAPSQIPLDMEHLQADFYTGACHKWMMAPKGASFLYAKESWHSLLDPLVVSWGYPSLPSSQTTFIDHHEMQGTRDLAAFCTVPVCIDFMQQHNWLAVSAQAKQLSMENAVTFCQQLATEPIAPIGDHFCTQMYSTAIKSELNHLELNRMLYQHYNIQAPFMLQGTDLYIRYSVQAFNSQNDLDKLLDALLDMRTKGWIA